MDSILRKFSSILSMKRYIRLTEELGKKKMHFSSGEKNLPTHTLHMNYCSPYRHAALLISWKTGKDKMSVALCILTPNVTPTFTFCCGQ